MSSRTWTPAALWSERRRFVRACWRVVEAQHRVATLKLVDTLDEQLLLEDVIERSKPAVPPECAGLHYLLSTPFRYGAPYPRGSRFRRAGLTPGVFYASEAVETAIAELGFHRLLFFADSPQTPWPINASEHTAFSVDIATTQSVDLTAAPFDRQSAVWTHPLDYGPTQHLADCAREARIAVLRYASARDAEARVNVAVLTCQAFAARQPRAYQTWQVRLSAAGVQALCGFPARRLEFGRGAFATDPRIAAMRWERGKAPALGIGAGAT